MMRAAMSGAPPGGMVTTMRDRARRVLGEGGARGEDGAEQDDSKLVCHVYSALMPRALMTRAHFFCSLSRYAAASSGVLAITVRPRSW